MNKHGKRFRKSADLVESGVRYSIPDAVRILKQFEGAKFDETVEVVMRLGIDPKRADQLIRGTIILPKGTGKTARVLVFAEGAKAEEAQEAGADFVGSEDLVKKIEGGWLDFDVALASPDMMRKVGKLGRVLGPHGKMPSPKSGTLTDNLAQSVKEFKGGKIEFRNDDTGNVHVPVGKKAFSAEDLVANIEAFVNHISGLRPPAAKGIYIQNISVSTTMGPGISLAI